MLITENTAQSDCTVTAYQNGMIEINGHNYHVPLVLKQGKVELNGVETPSELTLDDFFQTASEDDYPEVILVGTGEKQQFLHPKLIADVASRGIGLECMNTAAACRTLLLLQGEGRSVWAWLYP